jgi:hypothetical protein
VSRVRAVLPAALLLALSCGHGEPFGASGQGTDQPFQGGTPTQLTYNPLTDRDPTWLPDGSGIVYSGDRADHGGDRCLMVLPPAGGRVVRSICNDDPLAADSLKTYDAAAVSAGGRLAFVRASRPPTLLGATFDELASGLLASAPLAATIQTIPFTIDSTLYTGISNVRWLGEGAIVFRAGFSGVVCIDNGSPCATAFVESGLDLMVDTLGSAAPVKVPGAAFASSVAASAAGDTLYYTLNGDSRVYRRVVATGLTTTYHNFGSGAIARDVQVANGRVAAIIGGSVSTLTLPDSTPLQWDRGGSLAIADVASGVIIMVTDTTRAYRHPALSPNGKHVIVEANGDLWLYDLP